MENLNVYKCIDPRRSHTEAQRTQRTRRKYEVSINCSVFLCDREPKVRCELCAFVRSILNKVLGVIDY